MRLPRIICTQVIIRVIISQWGKADSSKASSEVLTVLDWAQEAGMMTGLVSTARVTHATPAALYAKSANRDWECDTISPEGVEDITRQLVESERGRNISLVFGGGRASFTPTNNISHISRDTLETFNCSRRDNVDMVARWQSLHPGQNNLKRHIESVHEKVKQGGSLLALSPTCCEWIPARRTVC